jgi:DNA-binding transcriptional ArsR family regulator
VAADLDRIFHALADPTRRSIFNALVLAATAVNITTIAEHFQITRQAITQHIGVLEEAGLVKVRRVGRDALYTSRPAALAAVHAWIAIYDRFWNEKLGALGAHLDRRSTRTQ